MYPGVVLKKLTDTFIVNLRAKKSSLFSALINQNPHWLLFFLALGLKLAFLFSVRHNPFVTHLTIDEVQHDAMARSILEHGLLQPAAFYFAPLYPYLVAAFYWVSGGSLFFCKVMQCLAGALNVMVVYLLAAEIFQNKRIALLSAVLTLLYGVYYFYEVLLMKETFAALFTVVSVWLLFRALRNPSAIKWWEAGSTLALSFLLRENNQLVALFVLFWLMFAVGKKTVKYSAVLFWLLGVVLVTAPVTIHNFLASRDFVLVTYQGGTNFYIGNHAGARGVTVPLRPNREVPAFEHADAVFLAESAEGRTLKPSEVSSFWFRKALQFIAGHPGEWLRLMGRKFMLFNNTLEIPDSIDFEFFKQQASLLKWAFVPFGLIVSLAAVGFCRTLSRFRDYSLLYLLTGVSVLSVVLGFICSRYRLPVVMFYILFAAAGLSGIGEALKKRAFIRLSIYLLSVVVVWVFSSQRIIEVRQVESHNNLAMIYLEMGEYEKALSHFKIVAQTDSDLFLVHANMAKAYEAAGDIPKAIEEMQFVVDRINSRPKARRELGQMEILQLKRELLELYRKGNALLAAGVLRKELIEDCESVIDEDVTKGRPPGGGEGSGPDQRLAALYAEKAALLMEDGREDEAILSFEKAATADQEYQKQLAAFYQYLGTDYLQKGDYQKAQSYLESALRLGPGTSQTYNNYGILLVRRGRREEALEYFTKAVEMNQNDRGARYNLGVALLEEGKYSQAEDELKKVVDSNPDYDKGYYSLGVLKARQGKPQEAVEYFKRALKINADFPAARAALQSVSE